MTNHGIHFCEKIQCSPHMPDNANSFTLTVQTKYGTHGISFFGLPEEVCERIFRAVNGDE